MWENQGLPQIIRKLSRDSKFGFDVERLSFAMALQRLCEPGSDLGGSQWVTTVEAPGFGELALQHFYRTAAFLAEVRAEIDTELSRQDRNLFTQDFDLMFIDTTSLYVYRDEENELFRRGHSRDHRPDLMRDMGQVHSVIVDLEGMRYRLRTSMVGSSYQAFQAAGVRPPETVKLPGPVSVDHRSSEPVQMSLL